jgi:hypothetical protein
MKDVCGPRMRSVFPEKVEREENILSAFEQKNSSK